NIVKIYINQKEFKKMKDYYYEISGKDEKLKEEFWMSLENNLIGLEDKEKKQVMELFSTDDSDYSLLNRIRLNLIKGSSYIDDKDSVAIKNLDFGTLPAYFADIIYFNMINKYPLEEILHNVREDKLQMYLEFLNRKYDDISEIMLRYLECMEEKKNLKKTRISIALEKSILVLDKIDKEQFKNVWDRYISDGTYYINEIYNQIIISNELIYDVKNEEHAFFVYMLLANEIK